MVRRRNIFSMLAIAGLSLILIAFIVLLALALSRNAYITSEITSKCGIINEYVNKTEMSLSEESIALLVEERNRLKSVYHRFKLALQSPLSDEVAKEQIDPLQFKERLIQTQKRLREEAYANGMTLPPSLGFTKYETELSQTDEIPNLIHRLRILEELIAIMISSNVSSLERLLFSAPDEPKPKKKKKAEGAPDIAREIHITFTVECSHQSLMYLIYNMRSSAFTFTVHDLDITRNTTSASAPQGAPSILTVEVAAKAMIIR